MVVFKTFVVRQKYQHHCEYFYFHFLDTWTTLEISLKNDQSGTSARGHLRLTGIKITDYIRLLFFFSKYNKEKNCTRRQQNEIWKKASWCWHCSPKNSPHAIKSRRPGLVPVISPGWRGGRVASAWAVALKHTQVYSQTAALQPHPIFIKSNLIKILKNVIQVSFVRKKFPWCSEDVTFTEKSFYSEFTPNCWCQRHGNELKNQVELFPCFNKEKIWSEDTSEPQPSPHPTSSSHRPFTTKAPDMNLSRAVKLTLWDSLKWVRISPGNCWPIRGELSKSTQNASERDFYCLLE